MVLGQKYFIRGLGSLQNQKKITTKIVLSLNVPQPDIGVIGNIEGKQTVIHNPSLYRG